MLRFTHIRTRRQFGDTDMPKIKQEKTKLSVKFAFSYFTIRFDCSTLMKKDRCNVSSGRFQQAAFFVFERPGTRFVGYMQLIQTCKAFCVL